MPTTTGMAGGGYYDAHSAFQAKVAESGAALLSEAVAAVHQPDPDAPVVVADYGCAEGRNSISTVGRALDAFAARGAAEFCVLHNDLPSNDFATLIQNLAGAAAISPHAPRPACSCRRAASSSA